MPQITLATTAATDVEADALLVGATAGRDGSVDLVGADGLGDLVAAVRSLPFRAGEDEVVHVATLGTLAAPVVVVVGLGDVRRLSAESLRRATGAGIRAAAGLGHVATTLAQAAVPDVTPDGALRAVAEGALLGAYDYTAYRHASLEGRRLPVAQLTVLVPQAKTKAALASLSRAEVVARGVELARDLVNTPAGNLHPADLAAVAVKEAENAGVDVEVWDEKALKKGGFGGILGVGQGSANPPRLVRLGYTHPKAKRTLALVGKGITFDSGGLSIKPATAMEWMKVDMAGAAAVIAATAAAAALELRVNITGWVPTAENMPGGGAIRPGDVLTMYGGKRVEVLNTDAEGRLILGDALVRACEESPTHVLDVATLTGAALIALGKRTAGVMANDDAWRERVVAAADAAGELAWGMPLPAELRKSIDSDVGDITNTGDRMGGMLVGGVFLREFVPAGTKWAHFDIAGPSWNDGEPWGYTPKQGTGYAVRTFVTLAEDLARR